MRRGADRGASDGECARERGGARMTKSELVQRIAERQSLLAMRDVELGVKTMVEHMTACLAAGGRIEIRGFGSFSLHYRRGLVGRNPLWMADGTAFDPRRSGLEIAVPGDASPPGAWVRVDRLDGTVFAR